LCLPAFIFGAALRPSERKEHPAGNQSMPSAQVRGLACVAAAAQRISLQGFSELRLGLALEAQTRRAAILKASF
jgi:hypothetical protein